MMALSDVRLGFAEWHRTSQLEQERLEELLGPIFDLEIQLGEQCLHAEGIVDSLPPWHRDQARAEIERLRQRRQVLLVFVAYMFDQGDYGKGYPPPDNYHTTTVGQWLADPVRAAMLDEILEHPTLFSDVLHGVVRERVIAALGRDP